MLANEGGIALPDIRELQGTLIGSRFPGGTTTILHSESYLGQEALEAPIHTDGRLHAVWPLIVGLRGMGTTITDLCDMVHMRPGDSFMLGELDIDQSMAMSVGVQYSIAGGIRGITRRLGAQSGVFDLLTVELEIRDPSKNLVSTLLCSLVFVRRARG